MTAPATGLRPFFLPVGEKRLFCLARGPARGTVVLFAPPFAEEMNRSRRLLHDCANALAAAGLGSLLFDLSGTGDSSGDFTAATWEGWRDDIAAAAHHLAQQGAESLILVALRLGALLALETLPRLSLPVRHIILVAPQLDGAAALRQFLRIKTTRDRFLRHEEEMASPPARLEDALAHGAMVEVAGYGLSPVLTDALGKAVPPPRIGAHVTLIECADTATTPPSRQDIKTREALDAIAPSLACHRIIAPRVWAQNEPAPAPALAACVTSSAAEAARP
ncbi:MAG: serine aminopeptidase domain-containing protein [Pseudomonadota bacterium]